MKKFNNQNIVLLFISAFLILVLISQSAQASLITDLRVINDWELENNGIDSIRGFNATSYAGLTNISFGNRSGFKADASKNNFMTIGAITDNRNETISIEMWFNNTDAGIDFFLDLTDGVVDAGVCYFRTAGTKITCLASGTVYINNVSAGTVILNDWTHFIVSGILVNTRTGGDFWNYRGHTVGQRNLAVDLIRIYNGTLTSSNVSTLYANGRTYNYTTAGNTTTGAAINFYLNSTSDAIYYNETRKSFYVGVNVTDFKNSNTTIRLYNNGTLYLNYTGISNFSKNFTNLPNGNYTLNATATNGTSTINLTNSKNFAIYGILINITNPNTDAQNASNIFTVSYNPTITPSVATFTNFNITLRNNDSSFNQTINGSATTNSFTFDLYNLNLSIGSYRFGVLATDSLGNKKNTTSEYINLNYNAVLNVTAYYARDNSSIINFTINIIDLNSSQNRSYSTINGSLNIEIIRERNYTLYFDSEGYALTSINLTSNSSEYQSQAIGTYTTNSILVYIFDENTFLLITANITVTFTGPLSEIITSTINGTLYQDNLPDGAYTIKFIGQNYTTKNYNAIVENKSFQTLNAFLSSTYETVIFTIQDSSNSATLEGAAMTMERLINSSYVVVESKLSDITGRAEFSYLAGVKYKFTISLTDYTTKIFYLDPVIFSTYTINLERIIDVTNEADYSDLQLALYPTIFINNRTNNITFTISSPTGKLENYSIRVSAPGGNDTGSGFHLNGETIILYFNITGANLFDKVNVTYTYQTTTGGLKTYSYRYGIIGPMTSVSNHTIANIKLENYGMGMFEKAFLVMIIVILVAGFSYMALGMGGALFVGLVLEGAAVYLGMLPIAAVLISLLVGIILFLSSSTGGKS